MGSVANAILSELKKGPLLGSELRQKLFAKGFKPATVGREVQRLRSKGLAKAHIVSFTRGQLVYFLPDVDKSSLDQKIMNGLKKRTKLYRLYRALLKDKVLTYKDALKIAAVPEEKRDDIRETPLKDLLTEMKQLDLIDEIQLDKIQLIALKGLRDRLKHSNKLLQRVEDGLATENKLRIRFTDFLERFGIAKEFEHFESRYPYFDAVGKAVTRKKIFVAVEVNSHRPVNLYDINGIRDRIFFLKRIRGARSIILYFMGLFDSEAWKAANNMGWHTFSSNRFEQLNSMILVRGRGFIGFKKGVPPKRIIATLENWEELKQLGYFRARFFEAEVRNIFDLLQYRTRNPFKIYEDRYGELTTDWNKRRRDFAELDVLATKGLQSESLVIICECKNWNEPIYRHAVDEFEEKLESVSNFLKKTFSTEGKPVKTLGILVGNTFGELIEADKRAIPIKIFEKANFDEFKNNPETIEKELGI